MSEHWRKVSFVNEEEIETFFQNFCNWKLIASRTDIEGGGIDLIFEYYNPFSDKTKKKEYILIESKHIEGDYLNPYNLEDQVYKLKKEIESFRDIPNKIPHVYDSVEELEGPLTKGIIVHRFENFSKKKFEKSIRNLNLRNMKRYNPPTIYLLNNYQIARFKELYLQCRKPSFYWFYPSMDGNQSYIFYKNPIPNYLFSEFGFLLPGSNFEKDYIYFNELNNKEKLLIFYIYNEPIRRVCIYIKSIFDSLKIKPKIVKEYYFLEGNHNEKDTYLNNLKRADISITENQLNIIEVNDNKINDFRVSFKK
ncbi:MAG: hypothetical protein ACTSQP_23370 [Promethearchaeota archaeon]